MQLVTKCSATQRSLLTRLYNAESAGEASTARRLLVTPQPSTYLVKYVHDFTELDPPPQL